jgi:predicted alpha/beta superfamily hydrolase
VAYKFKIDRPEQPAAGWESGANRAVLLKPGNMTLDRVFGSNPDAPPLQRTGRIDRIAALPSAHVSPREVQVWLPPGYEQDDGRRYPVLYLQDGQNVFDAAGAGAEWQVDEAAQRLVLAGEVAPLIIVGVASGDTRIQDYTPVPSRGPGGVVAGGGAAAYARYLTQELKPLIDRRYRTRPGRDSTAVGGSSLGGLVSMWSLLAHGDTFGAALVVSPSVWWADEDILKQVPQRAPGQPVPRIWLDVGVDEGPGMVAGARRLRQALAAAGWPSQYLEADGAGHDEASWAARVPQMLRFLQPAEPPRR